VRLALFDPAPTVPNFVHLIKHECGFLGPQREELEVIDHLSIRV
jgi:hypothetical protein